MNERLVFWSVMFILFSMVHACATFTVSVFCFGLAEAGSVLAVPLAIIGFILAPLWILGEWLTFVLPDNAAILAGIFANSILWWGVLLIVYSLFIRQAKSRTAADFKSPVTQDAENKA